MIACVYTKIRKYENTKIRKSHAEAETPARETVAVDFAHVRHVFEDYEGDFLNVLGHIIGNCD